MISNMNHDKIGVTNGGNLCLLFYAFIGLHRAYRDQCLAEHEALPISSMQLTYEGQKAVTDVGFREFLQRISAFMRNARFLSPREVEFLEMIREFLEEKIVEEQKPSIEADTRDLKDIIAGAKQGAEGTVEE